MTFDRPARAARQLVAVVAVALALGAGAAVAEDATWHAETLTSSPRGLDVTQYWSKGADRMRADTVLGGHRIVTIVNGKTYYSIDETAGTVLAIKRSPRAIEGSKKRPRLIGLEGFVIAERGGEKVGTELLAGQKCDIFKNTDANGSQQVWVQQGDAKERLPMRVEVYSRQAGATIRTDYVRWIQGVDIADSFFVPDPSFEVESVEYEAFAKDGPKKFAIPVLHGMLLHGDR